MIHWKKQTDFLTLLLVDRHQFDCKLSVFTYLYDIVISTPLVLLEKNHVISRDNRTFENDERYK